LQWLELLCSQSSSPRAFPQVDVGPLGCRCILAEKPEPGVRLECLCARGWNVNQGWRYTRVMLHSDAKLIPVSLDPSPVIDAYKEGVDRTLLRENLKLTTSQRVEKMTSALRFAEAVRHSRIKAVAT